MVRRILFLSLIIFVPALYCGFNAAGASDKKQEIADSLFEIELMGGDSLGYSSEILDFFDRVCGIKPSKYSRYTLEYNDGRDFAHDDIALYSIMSGGLAIRQSLQLDTIGPAGNDNRDIDITKVKGPKLNFRPFSDMLKGRRYMIFPLDKYAPNDFYYIHFSRLSKGLDFFDYIEQVGGAVHQRFTMRAADFMVKQKIIRQLALRDDEEAGAFYSTAVGEAAVTGSDPFIIEGSDVTLILRVKVPDLFRSTVAAYRKYFQDVHRAERKTVKIEGIDAEYLYTSDRRISSVLFTLPDGTVIISNSVKAAGIVAAAALGKRRCMADEPDYRYMRSVYPASFEGEDGFIYLSESFVRRIFSPGLRISEARRVREAMRITLLEKYVIFFTQLNGYYPSSLEEALTVTGNPPVSDSQKKYLAKIRHSEYHKAAMKLQPGSLKDWDTFKYAITPEDGGTKKNRSKRKKRGDSPGGYISQLKRFYRDVTGEIPRTPSDVFNLITEMGKPGSHYAGRFAGLVVTKGSYAVTSQEYGRYGFMVPNIEKEVTLVSSAEVSAYRKFTEGSSEYRENYFGPGFVRFSINGGIDAQTCIMPLIDDSVYNSLSAMTGRGAADLHPDDITGADVFSFCLKLNPEDAAVDGIFRVFAGRKSRYTDLLGSEFQIHIGDSLPVTDFDGAFLLEEYMTHGFDRTDAFTGLLVWSLFHPVRIALPVKKPEQVLALLDMFDTARLVGREYLQNERYSFDYRGSTVRTVRLTLFYTFSFRIYYTVKNGMLHIATTEQYIKSVLDLPSENKAKTVRCGAVAVFRPAAMVLGRDSYSSGIIESALEASRRNSGTMRLLSIIYPSSSDRDLPGLACRDFGFMPVCALGGEYTIDRRTGEVFNSVYGSGMNPVLKPDNGRDGMGDSLKRFFGTSQVRVELEFTDEGLMTRILTE